MARQQPVHKRTILVPEDLNDRDEFYFEITSSPSTSQSHVTWYSAHNRTVIQRRSFDAQRTPVGCWQASPGKGLFPCILTDLCVHFLTLSTPPSCVPLARSYDSIFTCSLGVLLHDSQTNAMALLKSPFHVEDPPVALRIEDPVAGNNSTDPDMQIMWTSSIVPLFLAYHPRQQRLTLNTVDVAGACVKPIQSFSSSNAPQCPMVASLRRDRDAPRWLLRLSDSRWVLMMQSNTGELVWLKSGEGHEGDEDDDDVIMDAKQPDCDNGAGTNNLPVFTAMLESVNAGWQSRIENRALSQNVLGGETPIDDVENLPFHLAYAVLAERRANKGMLINAADATAPNTTHGAVHQDTRVFEACELLSSTRPVVLNSRDDNTGGSTDDDGNNRYQQQLLQAARRTLSLALGRGAMYLGTYDVLPTELLESPDIDLSGRIVERNDAIVALDLSSDQPAPGGGALSERTAWPEFQNGAASALRINKNISNLSRTWIVYNKPKTPSYDHAGFLFGLGLAGQLSCLTVTDLYRYLSHEHDATLVGILLGVSASKRGSMDATITKMLFLHLPSRHPLGYPDLEIAPVVQCASLLGIGMVFQGTGQRSIAEMLLGEIDSAGVGDDVKKGGGYSLMAGFGLGLVMSSGNSMDGREIYEEELGWLMNGGRKKKEKDAGIRKEEKKKGANAIVQEELLASQRRPRTLLEQGLVPRGSKEGACVALGIIWMQSMEERVFDMMALDTHLDPEDVMLRVWMRCLIMWDADLPTWLDMNQIEVRRGCTANAGTAWQRTDSLHQMNELGRSLGVHLALACKYSGSGNNSIRDYMLEEVDRMLDVKLQATDAAVKEVVEMAICFSVLSTAVVMAGTQDLRTFGYARALMNCNGLYCGSMWYEALGLGTGLLFLSMDRSSTKRGEIGEGGCCDWIFGGAPEDVAYLIIALYPSSTPEKYWSFCRNLWVLAGGISKSNVSPEHGKYEAEAEDEKMTLESVLLRIRSCGLSRSDRDVHGLMDTFLSSCGTDEQVADAVVESLVDRIRISSS